VWRADGEDSRTKSSSKGSRRCVASSRRLVFIVALVSALVSVSVGVVRCFVVVAVAVVVCSLTSTMRHCRYLTDCSVEAPCLVVVAPCLFAASACFLASSQCTRRCRRARVIFGCRHSLFFVCCCRSSHSSRPVTCRAATNPLRRVVAITNHIHTHTHHSGTRLGTQHGARCVFSPRRSIASHTRTLSPPQPHPTDVQIEIDINVDIYPIEVNDNLSFSLVRTLDLEGSSDQGFFDQSGRKNLLSQFEYAMHGKVFNFT
jgi:hypothetical protein